MWGGRGTSITLSFGIKTFDGVVKSPPSTDALYTLCISNHAVGYTETVVTSAWRNPRQGDLINSASLALKLDGVYLAKFNNLIT